MRVADDPGPREQSAYPLIEATRYMRVPAATLRVWTLSPAYPTRRSPCAAGASHRAWYAVKELRQTLEFAETGLDKRLLPRLDLRSRAGQVFLARYGQLINLSASGRLAMRPVLEQHLDRVTFGRPVLSDLGISTKAVVARIDAGESPADVASDYRVS